MLGLCIGTRGSSSGSASNGIAADAISYLRISPLMHLISYRDHDIAWYIANTDYFDTMGPGAIPIVDPLNPGTLVTNNAFGTTDRITNDTGGLVWDGTDGSTADYAIDHLTGLGWYLQDAVAASTTWITAASNIYGATLAGFSDWRMPTSMDCKLIDADDGINANVLDSIHSFTKAIWWTMDASSASNATIFRDGTGYISSTKYQSITTAANSSIIGVACRNHYTAAQAVPVSYAYNMPQPIWDVSYNTYDEGWHNINDTYSNTVPADSLVQLLEDGNFYKVQYDAEGLGHTHRFLGLDGGYYNGDDGNYYDVDDVLSDRATEFEADDYAFDRLTGLGWRTVRGGSTTLTAGITNAEAATWNGFTDWHVPFLGQADTWKEPSVGASTTFAPNNPIFDITLQFKVCTPYGGAPTTSGWLISTTTDQNPNRAYTTNDSTMYVRDARGQF